MILTRTDTSAQLTLPDDYYWEDEHATGAALIQEAVRKYRELRELGLSKVNSTWVDVA
jgi:hypothetical protein